MEEKIQLELRKFVAPEYIFGVGARMMAGNYCRKLGGRKVFLASDAGVMKTQWFGELVADLKKNYIEHVIFSSISPNPRDTEVMKGAEVYLKTKCNMILAIGGGSVIDCAKGIGIVSTNHENILKFEGIDMIKRPLPPMVCIPTSGGTSADVSQFAIINNIEERYKMAIISKAVVPDTSLIDPFVLTSMDSFLTACTGMDALSHAFEAFVSNASSAFTDLYALEAIRLIEGNLHNSLINPDDLQLRGKMMLASLYAGMAFSNASMGCTHSMSHSLGGYSDLPHGECIALMLPHVIAFNFSSAANRYKKIAETMELPVSGLSDKEVKNILIDHIIDLTHKLGIFTTLKARGVTSDIIPLLSCRAIKDPCNATNPRPPVRQDLEAIFIDAM